MTQFFPPSVVKRKKVVYLGFELVFSTIILNSQDRETAAKLSNSCEKTQLYRELASAAESGWDFSTRWMRFGCALFNFSFIFYPNIVTGLIIVLGMHPISQHYPQHLYFLWI